MADYNIDIDKINSINSMVTAVTASTTPVDNPRRRAKGTANDAVEHPSHYTEHPSGVECIEITRHFNFPIGNAIKYLWRAGLKDGGPDKQIEDLKKAVWYITDEIKTLESARDGQ